MSGTADLIASTQEARLAAFTGLNGNLDAFRDQLDAAYTVDWDTGATQVDESAVRAAAMLVENDGGPSGDDLVKTLNAGFAVVDAAKQDAIPWRTLADPDQVLWVPDSRLKAIGVSNRANVGDLLRARHPSMPAFVDVDLLVGALDDKKVDAHLEAYARLAKDITTWAGKADPGDGGGKGGGGGGVPPVSADLITRAIEYVGKCLPKATLTQVSLTVGVGICLDQDCALGLAGLLLGGAGAHLINAAVVAIKAGELAALSTVKGGWVGLIVAICIVGFALWLRSVTTQNGACIHFPWWLPPMSPVPFGR